VLTVKVLEVGQLDALAHAQKVGSGAEAVEHHPHVTRIESGDGIGSSVRFGAKGKSVLNISPRSHDGAEHHQTEREQGQGRDGAAEPEHFSIRNYDDCQVLEDGVDGDREELEGPGARIDHADEEERDGEPCRGISTVCAVKMSLDVHFLASSLLKSRYEMRPALLHNEMAATQTIACRLVSAARQTP
jgi:hypothetical protein